MTRETSYPTGAARRAVGVRNRTGLWLCALGGAVLLLIAVRAVYRKADSTRKPVTPAEQHYQAGMRFAQSGDPASAAYQWKTAIGLDPTFAPAYLALAQQDEQRGNDAASADRLERLRAANPRVAQLDSRLARLYFRAGRYEKGMARAREAVRSEPNDAFAHAVLGDGLAQAGEMTASVQELRAARRLAPEDEAILLTLAQGLGRVGDIDEALALARPLLARARNPARANLVLGELLMQRRSPQAGDYLHISLALAPAQAQVQSALGSFLLREGHPAAAQPLLERAYRQNPTDARALQDLAAVYARLQRPAARRALQAARALQSCQTALLRARRQYLKAPNDRRNALLLARLEAQRGNGPDAMDLVMQALHADPDDPAALGLLHRLTTPKRQ
jgi:predicted Zn-dependent protease